MKTTAPKERTHKGPSTLVLNILTVLVALVTLGAGIGWLVYSWVVDMEVPYFAIPFVLCVPVIAAVAFRNFWD